MRQPVTLLLQLELAVLYRELTTGKAVVGERRGRLIRMVLAAIGALSGREPPPGGSMPGAEAAITALIAGLAEGGTRRDLIVQWVNGALESSVRPLSERAGGGR